MLDINFIRNNKELVEENNKKRNSKVSVKEILDLDERRRKLITEIDGLKAQQNKRSKKNQALQK